MGFDEFLNRMVEVLGIIIDRRPKGRSHKRENSTIERIGCISILIILIMGDNKID